jgi:protein-glutamine gamma-glutamyltransferase
MLSGRPQGTETVTIAVAIQRYFDVALYLLVLTGFGTLASTGGLDFPTVMLVGGALLARGYLLATRHDVVISQRWTNYLTLMYLAFSVADYLLLSRNFLSALVHLVLFVMVVRLFSLQRERDHFVLSILSFLMVLAAAVLTVDATFLLAFAGFVLIAVVTFVLMEMRYSSGAAAAHAKEVEERHEYRSLALSLAALAPLLMFLILVAGSFIFFMLPRVAPRYLMAYSLSNDISTGFTDRVQLGRIGEIQQSGAVVMHIQIDGDAGGTYDLKWRGVALSLFDGRDWSTLREYLPPRRLPDGAISLLPATAKHRGIGDEPAVRGGTVIHYQVMMEPIGSNVFFLAPKATRLQGNYGRVMTDAAGAVYDLDPERPVGRYEASSNIARPTADQLRSASETYPASIELADLQLPKVDARLPRLAKQITAAANNNYDKAMAIERYLMTHYGYTLELPRLSPPDPLANFLFERKRGHCEYFASSMAIMLRTLRIPARVVNGFRTGEFNDLTSNYLVRASNAHSWVEAYFPDYDWVSFDPTPPAALPVQGGWRRMMLYLDAMASFWREWVIAYDASHQKILGQQAARGSRALMESMRLWGQAHFAALLRNARQMQSRMARSPRRWLAGALLLTVLLLLLANGRQIWKLFQAMRLRAHPERAPGLAAAIWYEHMTRALERRGWRKLPAQTPAEFASTIADVKLRERVLRFTRHYESARFGDSANDACQLPELYEEIKAAEPK